MKLSELLTKDTIIPELKGTTKVDVINELVDLLKGDSRVEDLEELRRAVFEREKILSTGVGQGIAIPHAKTDAVNDVIVAFGRSSKQIEYQALDEKPVTLVFLLIGKANYVTSHIKFLSRISRMFNREDFRQALREANTVEAIKSVFVIEEENYMEL